MFSGGAVLQQFSTAVSLWPQLLLKY